MQDKIEGSLNENLGKAKAAVGNAVHNDDLVIQGKAQQAKGIAQQVVGEVKDKASEKIADAKSAVDDHSH